MAVHRSYIFQNAWDHWARYPVWFRKSLLLWRYSHVKTKYSNDDDMHISQIYALTCRVSLLLETQALCIPYFDKYQHFGWNGSFLTASKNPLPVLHLYLTLTDPFLPFPEKLLNFYLIWNTLLICQCYSRLLLLANNVFMDRSDDNSPNRSHHQLQDLDVSHLFFIYFSRA